MALLRRKEKLKCNSVSFGMNKADGAKQELTNVQYTADRRERIICRL